MIQRQRGEENMERFENIERKKGRDRKRRMCELKTHQWRKEINKQKEKAKER
jgi:hypothetical protein